MDQSEQSLQKSPAGESQPPDVPGEQSQRARAAEKPPQQNRREVQNDAQRGDAQRRQERGRTQSDESTSGSPPGQAPSAAAPPPQPSREQSQRNQSDREQRSKSRQESQRDSQSPNVQQKQAEAARENAQPARKGAENIRQEQRSGPPAERRESNVQQGSGSAATKKLKVRSLAPRKASSKNPRATARRAREKRVTPRAKAKATHRAAKDRARRGEASRPRLPTVVSLDFVAETTIFSGYEKIVPRFRLRGVRLGFGVCRRLLLGQEVQGGRQDRGFNQAELGALNSIDHLHKRSAG